MSCPNNRGTKKVGCATTAISKECSWLKECTCNGENRQLNHGNRDLGDLVSQSSELRVVTLELDLLDLNEHLIILQHPTPRQSPGHKRTRLVSQLAAAALERDSATADISPGCRPSFQCIPCWCAQRSRGGRTP
eukprot:1620563-Rhodomonas_salina.1